MFNRFPVWSEQRQCSNNVPHLRQEPVTPADFPIAQRVTGVLHHTQKSKETQHFPRQSCPTAVGTMVHQMSQGDPQGLGAHAGPPSLRPHLPFHHSEGPGRRKPGHGRGMVWPGRGTQGRTDLGLCWAPHPVTTTLGVYKVLGIIVGFWQKAMEPKSLRMVFKEKTSLKIHSVPALPLLRCTLLVGSVGGESGGHRTAGASSLGVGMGRAKRLGEGTGSGPLQWTATKCWTKTRNNKPHTLKFLKSQEGPEE